MEMAFRREILLAFLLLTSKVLSAPVAQNAETNEKAEIKLDVPVEQLEKLKMDENTKEGHGPVSSEHIEYHRLDAVKANGELVSRLEQHTSADSASGEKPHVHSEAQLDVPSEGVHQILLGDGRVINLENPTTTTAPNGESTTKVFHGAARLIQTGLGSNNALTNTNGNTHTAVRRRLQLDNKKEKDMDGFSGIKYSPVDMAEYVFWTGDERGIASTIEDFLNEGVMSKEEALDYLQQVKDTLNKLRSSYIRLLKRSEPSEELLQQERLRNMLMEQASAKEYQYHTPSLQTFPYNTPDVYRGMGSKNWEMSNSLQFPSYPTLPITDLRPEPLKRTFDPMMQTNIISTSDYDRDGPVISEEEYEEMMDKLKAADTLYTEYTLEEIIYQLAKMLFSGSLSRDPASARAATQRFMAFLELEAERGQLSRTIEKKVLDVMIAALTDTIGDHPELLQAHEGHGPSPGNRLMRQFLEASSSEPSMSRAILSAYKDELLKGPTH